jgi:hypothetical protein
MLQQRKKDYLIRLLEELMKKINQMLSQDVRLNEAEKGKILRDCFDFFEMNYHASDSDSAGELIEKIPDTELLEQYPRLLMTQYDLSAGKDNSILHKALAIIQFLEATDKTYSWERVVLREDILHRLDDPPILS